ncbi:MAG: tetratricopeptide repeat protein [Burkholderiales bacterium]|nr:tetratricopeptide repeat protein [Burkholderiales bacterium]
MMRPNRPALLSAITAVLLCAFAPVHGAKPENWTEGELQLAAPYCIDTMGFRYGDSYFNPSPRAKHWVGLMGKGFWTMHHYCWALVNMKRAQSGGMSRQARDALMNTVVDDMNFVLRNAGDDFIMRPEVLMRMGDALRLMGQLPRAIEAYMAATRSKPDYWPAYQRWAELLVELKSPDQARRVLAEGLGQAPDAPTLQSAYRQLGGDPATIARRPAPAAAAPAAAPAAASAASVPAAAASEAPAPSPAVAPAPAASAASGAR